MSSVASSPNNVAEMPCGGWVRRLASLPALCPNSHRRPDSIGGPKPAAETEDKSAGTWRLTRAPNPRWHLRRRRRIESRHRSQRKGRADADAVASSAKSAARTVTGKKENMRERVHVKEEENKLTLLLPLPRQDGRGCSCASGGVRSIAEGIERDGEGLERKKEQNSEEEGGQRSSSSIYSPSCLPVH